MKCRKDDERRIQEKEKPSQPPEEAGSKETRRKHTHTVCNFNRRRREKRRQRKKSEFDLNLSEEET